MLHNKWQNYRSKSALSRFFNVTISCTYFTKPNLELPVFSSDSTCCQLGTSCSTQAMAPLAGTSSFQQMKALKHLSHQHWKSKGLRFSSLPFHSTLHFISTHSACCSKREKLVMFHLKKAEK